MNLSSACQNFDVIKKLNNFLVEGKVQSHPGQAVSRRAQTQSPPPLSFHALQSIWDTANCDKCEKTTMEEFNKRLCKTYQCMNSNFSCNINADGSLSMPVP